MILNLPFPCRVNPLSSWLAQHVERSSHDAWLGRTDPRLGAVIEQSRFHQLAARVHPRADAQGLLLVFDLITFLFFFDDLLDSSSSCIGTNPQLAADVADVMFQGFCGIPGTHKSMQELPLQPIYSRRLTSLCLLLERTTTQLRSYGCDPDHYFSAAKQYLDAVVEEAQL